MTAHTHVLARSATVLGAAVSLGAAAFIGLGCGLADADVKKIGAGPTVKSRQASQNSVIRINDFGVARGISEARVGDAGIVSAQGEVRDGTKAVVGSKPSPFRGSYPVGPAIGDW
jgi:hypothetical protein